MRKWFRGLKPNFVLMIGFALIILGGAVLLYLPVSHQEGVDGISFVDALFTATTSVCVTGLTTVDVGNVFSLFGQIVIALLIQLGGLGFASVATSIMLILKKDPGFGTKGVLKEALNTFSGINLKDLVRTLFYCSLICETTGALLYFTQFCSDFSITHAIWVSIFTAISAFNNAGIDLFGGYMSLNAYADNPVVLLTTASLIAIGGLGFFVVLDIIHRRRFRRYRFHTKIVLTVTGCLITIGTLLIWLLNDGKVNFLNSLFLSVSTRTAGFASFDLNILSHSTLLVVMFLMFVGASPGSTGGGIKTTTFFALLMGIFSSTRKTEARAYKRRISQSSIIKAFIVATLAMWVIILTVFLVLSVEKDGFTLTQVAFEAVSAFGTVGLSLGITPYLHTMSKIFIILLMFIGRLGPLTFVSMWKTHTNTIEYIAEEVQIG